MKKFLSIFFLFCACHTLVADSTRIVLLYSNNSNGLLENCHCPEHAYGALEKRAYVVDSIRSKEKNILLLDSGDILDIVSNRLLHSYMLRAYDFMKYDLWVAGDQDFVEGPDFFLQDMLNLNMIFLNTNLEYKDKMPGKKYIVEQFTDIKIGITGTINPAYQKYLERESQEQFRIKEQEENLDLVLQEMSPECDYIVLISHSGLDKDEQLAERFPNINLIIGGHSQILTKKPKVVGETVIVQGGESGYRLGTIYLTFNNNKLKNLKNKFILLDKDIPDHPEIVKLIKEYHRIRLTGK